MRYVVAARERLPDRSCGGQHNENTWHCKLLKKPLDQAGSEVDLRGPRCQLLA